MITVYSNKVSDYKFLAKNTNMLTKCGFREDCLSDKIYTDVLNSLSDATLVAQMHRYFVARTAKLGK